jgi:transposase InsO family protein
LGGTYLAQHPPSAPASWSPRVVHTLAAPRSIGAARPDGLPIYVIMDNLSANKAPAIRAWAPRHKVELCFTPAYASWANPRPSSVRCAPSS